MRKKNISNSNIMKTTQPNIKEIHTNKIITNKIKQNSNMQDQQNSFSDDLNNNINISEINQITSEEESLYYDLGYNPPPNNNSNIRDFSEIKPVGLINVNFSCYMNSCLQCFYHCKLFINEILKIKSSIKFKNAPITNALIDLIDGLISIGSNNSSPKGYQYPAKKFYDTLIKKYPKFKYSLGNDPKAVSSLILLFMPQELKPEFSYRADQNLNKNNEESLFEDIYYKYNKNLSFFSSNFYWCLKKKKICKNCKKKKLFTYSFQYNHMHNFYISQICKKLKKNNCTLIDCFNFFKEPDEDNSIEFMCYNCKNKVIANRILYYMATLPNYLIICLNDEGALSQYYKLAIDSEINLEEIFLPPKNYKGTRETKYEFHCGVFIRGARTHAVAICKHFDKNYYEFDDSNYKVYDIRRKLKNEIPYLLFYRRKDVPI